MAFIFLEGLDRSGKTTIAELYKKQGYEIVHFSAPNKKYSQPGYTGPSYLDEVIELYQQLTGKDIVFDRSPYGELVWPRVYNRQPQLSEEDIDVLRDFERQNNAKYILMHDPDMAGHWKRCVANNEPLDREQFKKAHGLFLSELNSKYGFALQQLKDYNIHFALDETPSKETLVKALPVASSIEEPKSSSSITINNKTPEQARLEKANAINDVLSKKIVKGRGKVYEDIESSIRTFLNDELGKILGQSNDKALSILEIEFIKGLFKRMNEKETSNGKRI